MVLDSCAPWERGRAFGCGWEDGGVIILAATPIGNLGDASRRLIEALTNATVIAAEDTRTAAHLLRALGIENRPRLIALHEHNETAKAGEIVDLARDEDVLVLTDAGMPAVSDPGFTLVAAAAAAGVVVTVLPGPSAVLTALAVSGLPTDRFTFEGFVPRKGRRPYFSELSREPRTQVFFESPHRLGETLTDLAAEYGADRRVVVCRELTKLHEEVRRESLSKLAASVRRKPVKGELVIVVEGAPRAEPDVDAALEEALGRITSGESVREATRAVAEERGVPRRALYDRVLETRGKATS